MTITDLRLILGATCIYVKATFSDDLITEFPLYRYFLFKSTVAEHGVIYSSTNDDPEIGGADVFVSNSYWDWTYFYPNIYYVDGIETPMRRLDPCCRYYLRVYCKLTSGKLIYSDVYKTYTTMRGGNPDSEDDNGGIEELNCPVVGNGTTTYSQCFNFEVALTSSSSFLFPSDRKADELFLLSLFLKVYKYYRLAGYFSNWCTPYRYNKDTATASCSSSTTYSSNKTPFGYFNFNPKSNMSLRSIIHEFGHFLEKEFREAQSGYVLPSRLSFGYLMGKRLRKLDYFLTNNPLATTKCHSGHVDPYVSYTISYEHEDKPFSQLLIRCMTLYLAILGQDGLIGHMNRLLVVPYYELEEGTYRIKSLESGKYYNSSLAPLSSQSSAAIWTVTFVPSTLMYTIKNEDTGKYITTTSSLTTTTETQVQIIPTIYNESGDSYVIMKSAVPTNGWDTDAYSRSRLRLTINSSTGTVSSITNDWKPRSKTSNFIFEKVS